MRTWYDMKEHGPIRIVARLCLIAISAIVLSTPLSIAAQDIGPDSLKYWIFFEDKPSPPNGLHKVTSARISQRALARRAVRGSITSNQLDVPISETYLERLRSLDVHIVHESRWLNAVSAFLTPESVKEIAAQPFVRSLRPVAATTTTVIHDNPSPLPIVYRSMSFNYGNSVTQLEKINAIGNIEQGINGTGVRLGILDAGVGQENYRFLHPVFDHMRADGRTIVSRDFTAYPDEVHMHPLAVASIAAGFEEGQLIGPAHGVELFHGHTEVTTNESETQQEEDNFVAGLQWMVEEIGVDVVNVSLGYYKFDGGVGDYTYEDMNGNTAITTIAADIAVKLGVVMVVSAGNEAVNSLGQPCTPDQCWYYVGAPADGDSVITVGATTPLDQRALFSSFGPTSDGRHKPDISAMGTRIVYAAFCDAPKPLRPCYPFLGRGTSFAAPLVAGVVAQMLQVNPNLNPLEIRDILWQTARIPDGTNPLDFPNDSLGWGIVDAGAAVAMAIVLDVPLHLPTTSSISAPYPLPASSVVRFDIETRSPGYTATLELFDLLGRRVKRITKNSVAQGKSRLEFNLGALSTGVYAYRILLGEKSETGTLVVIE